MHITKDPDPLFVLMVSFPTISSPVTANFVGCFFVEHLPVKQRYWHLLITDLFLSDWVMFHYLAVVSYLKGSW